MQLVLLHRNEPLLYECMKSDYFLLLPFIAEASNITLHQHITLHENVTDLAADVHASVQNASRRLGLFGKNKGSSCM